VTKQFQRPTAPNLENTLSIMHSGHRSIFEPNHTWPADVVIWSYPRIDLTRDQLHVITILTDVYRMFISCLFQSFATSYTIGAGFISLGKALALNYSRLSLRCEFESRFGRWCENWKGLGKPTNFTVCLPLPLVYSTSAPPRSNMAECGWRVVLKVSS